MKILCSSCILKLHNLYFVHKKEISQAFEFRRNWRSAVQISQTTVSVQKQPQGKGTVIETLAMSHFCYLSAVWSGGGRLLRSRPAWSALQDPVWRERETEKEKDTQRDRGHRQRRDFSPKNTMDTMGDIALCGPFSKFVCVCLFNTIKQNCKTAMLRESLKPQEA